MLCTFAARKSVEASDVISFASVRKRLFAFCWRARAVFRSGVTLLPAKETVRRSEFASATRAALSASGKNTDLVASDLVASVLPFTPCFAPCFSRMGTGEALMSKASAYDGFLPTWLNDTGGGGLTATSLALGLNASLYESDRPTSARLGIRSTVNGWIMAGELGAGVPTSRTSNEFFFSRVAIRDGLLPSRNCIG